MTTISREVFYFITKNEVKLHAAVTRVDTKKHTCGCHSEQLWPWLDLSIFKTSSSVPSLKNKDFYKLLSQPHKYLCHKKRKHNSRKLPTVDAPLNPSSIPVPNTVLGRSFHIRTWADRKDQENLDVLPTYRITFEPKSYG